MHLACLYRSLRTKFMLPKRNFGRRNKRSGVSFLCTFQGCEYTIWATIHSLRKDTTNRLFQPYVSPNEEFLKSEQAIGVSFRCTFSRLWLKRASKTRQSLVPICRTTTLSTRFDALLCNNIARMGLQNTHDQHARCIDDRCFLCSKIARMGSQNTTNARDALMIL
jgi:hypothetical protein